MFWYDCVRHWLVTSEMGSLDVLVRIHWRRFRVWRRSGFPKALEKEKKSLEFIGETSKHMVQSKPS